jgi:hypothetical protein
VLVRDDDGDPHRRPRRRQQRDAGQVAQAGASLVSAGAGVLIVLV